MELFHRRYYAHPGRYGSVRLERNFDVLLLQLELLFAPVSSRLYVTPLLWQRLGQQKALSQRTRERPRAA